MREGDLVTSMQDIRQEPYNLPAGFVWCTCDVFDETIMRDVYTLLNEVTRLFHLFSSLNPQDSYSLHPVT